MTPILHYMLVATLLSAASAAHASTDWCSLLQKRSQTSKTSLDFEVGPQTSRQHKIVDMMKHAWKGYAEKCFGKDSLHPGHKEQQGYTINATCGNDWGLGLTLIDSLDTLYLMGMDTEFRAARNWVANRDALDFDKVGIVSTFETTIRVLGGLLGAHAVSDDPIFLERAQELGDRLLPAFRGKSKRPPTTDVNLQQREGVSLADPCIAQSNTLGLEFKTLGHLTGMSKFSKPVELVEKETHKAPKLDGLLMNMEQAGTGGSYYGPYKVGGGGDSYYEYLLKQWLLTGRKDADSLSDYKEAMDGIRRHLVKKTSGPLQLTYVAQKTGDTIDKSMDHLVCFLPGTLALGAHYGVKEPWHLDLAKELMRTCYEMYKASGHMLGPEVVKFDTHGSELYIERQDAHDLLRPETVESLFYLYRLTKDKKYQDWGWQMAEAIERYAKVPGGGYSSLNSVFDPETKRDDMESFFPAETLKYLFLLFDDSGAQVPLDSFVFNTEAHPLRIIPELSEEY